MIVEIIAIIFLGLACLIAFTGMLGFGVFIHALMQLYKDDIR